MAPPTRKPASAESKTSEGARQSGRATTDRSRSDETRSRHSSESDPRSSNTESLRNANKFDTTSAQPYLYPHGPPQQTKLANLVSAPEPTPKQKPQPQLQSQPQPQPQSRPQLQPPTQLSAILRDFLQPQSGDYKACERYCMNSPAVWIQDVKELQELAIRCLREGRHELARRCAERSLMLTVAQQREWTAAQANAYLKSLSKSDDAFQDQLDKVIARMSLENTGTEAVASSSSGSYPPQSSSISNTPGQPGQPGRRASTVQHQTGPMLGVQREQTSSGQAFQQRAQGISYTVGMPYRGPGPPSQAQPAYATRAQPPAATAAAVETGADIEEASNYTGEYSLDDDITVDEQVRQERGIDEKTSGLGPIPALTRNYEGNDSLYASYKVYTGRAAVEFFVRGRVFAMVWHENAGVSAHANATRTSAPLDKPFNRLTVNADGVTIFSHIRRFVIVKAKRERRYCLAIPINSYRGRGLTDKGMRMDEMQAHTIIHASGSKPEPIRGEVKLNKEPIEVELEPGEELKSSSRLHFGKMQSIDWNVKVKNVGRITDPTHVRRLTIYFEKEFKKGDDTDTEGKAHGKSNR